MTAPRWDMLRDREAHVLVQKGPRESHPDPLLFKPRRAPTFVPFAWREGSKDLHSISHAITIGWKKFVVALVAELRLRLRAPCPTLATPIASALPTACETRPTDDIADTMYARANPTHQHRIRAGTIAAICKPHAAIVAPAEKTAQGPGAGFATIA